MSSELATDVRLIVLETLVRRLFETVLAALPAVQSAAIKQDIIDRAASWQLRPGTPPQDVAAIEMTMKLVTAQIRETIAMISEGEQVVRREEGWPPLDHPSLSSYPSEDHLALKDTEG